jgi:precorrin-4 methylase
MNTKREFNIKKLDTKKFLVTVYIEDELTPEEVVKRLEEGNKVLDQLNKDIEAIPEIVKARETQLTEQLKMASEEINIYNSVESIAKLWKKENEFLADRSGQKEVSQEDKE